MSMRHYSEVPPVWDIVISLDLSFLPSWVNAPDTRASLRWGRCPDEA
jgi:hypothetical protein